MTDEAVLAAGSADHYQSCRNYKTGDVSKPCKGHAVGSGQLLLVPIVSILPVPAMTKPNQALGCETENVSCRTHTLLSLSL